MIGYQDPNQGNQRRKALAQYLKSQSQQKARSANRMKAFGGASFSRSPGAGAPFRKGGGKASPERFAFAGMKPNLKTLLGLVGQTMGSGGFANTQFFSPDLPVGGLGWGGYVPNAPEMSQSMSPAPSMESGGAPGDPFLPQPGSGQQSLPGLGESFNNGLLTYNSSGPSGSSMLPGVGSFFSGVGGAMPGPGGSFNVPNGIFSPGYGGGGYTSPYKPILGDLMYGTF